MFVLTASGVLLNFPAQINSLEQTYPLETKKSFENTDPIKIGIIHSLTGTMALDESPVMDVTLLAIEEINNSGGLLGRELVPIIRNGDSDEIKFKEAAEELITVENVDVVFGGWTSASRKSMLPIFEKYDNLLFYPVQFEGLETSPNIIYTGSAPNQQILPALNWAYDNLGTRFYLVGSDYVFPKSANEIMKNRIKELGGEITGEKYLTLGDTNFNDIVDDISKKQPDVILNTINGDGNLFFFKTLREHGITSQDVPTISFSVSENTISNLGTNYMTGDYASWNYFQSIDSIDNDNFVSNFKNKFGQNRTINDPMEAAYFGVYLYAKAVHIAGTVDVHDVKKTIKGLTLIAPEGIIGIDPENHYTAKTVRIGKILSNGQFQIVHSTERAILPEPFPNSKSEKEWIVFLNNLYDGWGGHWSNMKNDEN